MSAIEELVEFVMRANLPPFEKSQIQSKIAAVHCDLLAARRREAEAREAFGDAVTLLADYYADHCDEDQCGRFSTMMTDADEEGDVETYCDAHAKDRDDCSEFVTEKFGDATRKVNAALDRMGM